MELVLQPVTASLVTSRGDELSSTSIDGDAGRRKRTDRRKTRAAVLRRLSLSPSSTSHLHRLFTMPAGLVEFPEGRPLEATSSLD